MYRYLIFFIIVWTPRFQIRFRSQTMIYLLVNNIVGVARVEVFQIIEDGGFHSTIILFNITINTFIDLYCIYITDGIWL